MESEINKLTKLPPKNFSIESIVGFSDRKSPEIDIESSITQEFGEEKLGEGKMGYFSHRVGNMGNFPFFMQYEKRFEGGEDLKRASPGSVRSEVDSDGVDERPHGEC